MPTTRCCRGLPTARHRSTSVSAARRSHPRRDGRRDRYGLCAIRRTGIDLQRPERFHRRAAIRPCKACRPGESLGRFSGMSRGRAPWRRRRHRRRIAGRSADADPLVLARSADVGSRRHSARSRRWTRFFGKHPGLTGCGPGRHPHSGMCGSGPRGRQSDDQIRRKRCPSCRSPRSRCARWRHRGDRS